MLLVLMLIQFSFDELCDRAFSVLTCQVASCMLATHCKLDLILVRHTTDMLQIHIILLTSKQQCAGARSNQFSFELLCWPGVSR